jgi:translocator protein
MLAFSYSAMAIAATGFVVTAAGGALVTQLGPWYYSLKKPSWQPPDWLFGPAWSLIFLCMACAFVLAYSNTTTLAQKVTLIAVFALNGGLNTLWSFLFFGLRRPDWAMIEVFPFMASIVLMMVATAPYDARAPWFFVPYLVWVAFATVLNAAIVRRNAPFGLR